jgi:hypothetical protein
LEAAAFLIRSQTEERVCSLLLSTAARDAPTLAGHLELNRVSADVLLRNTNQIHVSLGLVLIYMSETLGTR